MSTDNKNKKAGAVRVYVRKLDYSSLVPPSFKFEDLPTKHLNRHSPSSSSSSPAGRPDSTGVSHGRLGRQSTSEQVSTGNQPTPDDAAEDTVSAGPPSSKGRAATHHRPHQEEHQPQKPAVESFYNLSWDFPYVIVELDKLPSKNPTVNEVAMAAVAKAQAQWSGWKFTFMKQYEEMEKKKMAEEAKLEALKDAKWEEENNALPESQRKLPPIKSPSSGPTKAQKLRAQLLALNMTTVDCFDCNEDGTVPVTLFPKPEEVPVHDQRFSISRGRSFASPRSPKGSIFSASGDQISARNSDAGFGDVLSVSSMSVVSHQGLGRPGSFRHSVVSGHGRVSVPAATTLAPTMSLEELDETVLAKTQEVQLRDPLEGADPLVDSSEASLTLGFPRTLLVVDRPSQLVGHGDVEQALRELREHTIHTGQLKQRRTAKGAREAQKAIERKRNETVERLTSERELRQIRRVLESHKIQEAKDLDKYKNEVVKATKFFPQRVVIG